VPEGTDVRPLVHATAGDTVAGNSFLSYCQNGQTATYSAGGTTLDYTVTLLSRPTGKRTPEKDAEIPLIHRGLK